jgi:hypothetical protein
MENDGKDLLRYIPDNGTISYGALAEAAASNGCQHNDFLLGMHFLKFSGLIESDCEICSVTTPTSSVYLTEKGAKEKSKL